MIARKIKEIFRNLDKQRRKNEKNRLIIIDLTSFITCV